MLYVDGVGFSSRQEYEDALYDKEIIDDIKASCDLSTSNGINKAADMLKTVRFKSVLGDKFDDDIFSLYEKVREGSFVSKDSSRKKGTKANSKATKKSGMASNNLRASKRSDAVLKERVLDDKTKKQVVKELKRQNLIRRLAIAALLVVGFSSIGYFVKYYSDARAIQKQSEQFSELKDAKFAEFLSVKPVVKKTYSEEIVIPDLLDEYVALFNKNKSLIGWIKIADTIIDYPVMQTSDNEYYLKHNFNQDKDDNGCIFLDCNCDVILGNTNWILYGHHMNNGKMFSSLIKYANEDFYENHKIIQFDTIYEKGTYEVMYAFRSKIYNADEITFKYYQFIDAYSEAEFDSYMEEMDKLSLISTGVSASYGDRLLTLSTCDYQEENGRFVVVAKKID